MWGEDADMQLSDDDERRPNKNNSNTLRANEPHRWFILPAAATIASFGGIIFGYDIGIISGALLQLRCQFKLSCHEQEMIVTTLVIGALVASLCGGYLLDRFGRKITIMINALIFILGAAILAFSRSYAMFIIGRFILGFSVSLSAVADCVYISEIASQKRRGLLVTMNEMGITVGILISYFMNYALVGIPEGWRYMFAISSLPSMLQIVGMFFLPESPRWLANKDEDVKALEIIELLWPDLDPTQELDHLKNSICTERNYSVWHLFTKRENLRMRMFIGCGVVLFQQLSGQPSVIYYAPVLLQNLGYDNNDSATLATIGLGVMKVVFTFITLLSVDKLGRKTFLLIGATVMTLSLVILSGLTVSFSGYSKEGCHELVGTKRVHSHLLHSDDHCITLLNSTISCNIKHKRVNWSVPANNCSMTKNDIPKLPKVDSEISSTVKYASLIALMLYIVGYSTGYGPISWLLLSEIFPTGIKGRAVALASSVNWGTNILLSMTFLDMINEVGPFGIFLVYALIGILSVFFICQFVPETRGKSLEMVYVELNRANLLQLNQCCTEAETVNVEEEEWGLLLNNNGLQPAESSFMI